MIRSGRNSPGLPRILRFRAAFLALALLAVGAGAFSLRTKPLNLDIDFKAGTMLDLQAEKPVTRERHWPTAACARPSAAGY